MKTKEIRSLKDHEKWDIWTEGCVGGESAEEMEARVDSMIARIVAMTAEHHGKETHGNGDIVIVSHGRKPTI